LPENHELRVEDVTDALIDSNPLISLWEKREKIMNKILILIMASTFLLISVAFASSIGDPKTQGQYKFGLGLDQEVIYRRDLEFRSTDLELLRVPGGLLPVETDKLEIDEGYRTVIKVSFGFLSWLDMYAKLGVNTYEAETDFKALGTPFADLKTKAKWDFSFGGGLKMAHTFKNGAFIGGDIQYIRQKQDLKGSTRLFGTPLVTRLEGKDTWQEWHVASCVGYNIKNFLPYVGVRYSDVRLKTTIAAPGSTFGGEIEFKADNHFGTFLGLVYKIGDFSLNVEGRFVDETALSLGVMYQF